MTASLADIFLIDDPKLLTDEQLDLAIFFASTLATDTAYRNLDAELQRRKEL